jgi:hypothetical protein
MCACVLHQYTCVGVCVSVSVGVYVHFIMCVCIRRRVFTLRKDIAALCLIHGQLSTLVQAQRPHLDRIQAVCAHTLQQLSHASKTNAQTHAGEEALDNKPSRLLRAIASLSLAVSVPFFPDNFLLSSIEDQLSNFVIHTNIHTNTHPTTANCPYVYARTIARDTANSEQAPFFAQELQLLHAQTNTAMQQATANTHKPTNPHTHLAHRKPLPAHISASISSVMNGVDIYKQLQRMIVSVEDYVQAVQMLVYNVDMLVDVLENCGDAVEDIRADIEALQLRQTDTSANTTADADVDADEDKHKVPTGDEDSQQTDTDGATKELSPITKTSATTSASTDGDKDSMGSVTELTALTPVVATFASEIGRIWGSFVSCEATASYSSIVGSVDEYDPTLTPQKPTRPASRPTNPPQQQTHRTGKQSQSQAQLKTPPRSQQHVQPQVQVQSQMWRKPSWTGYLRGGLHLHLLLDPNQHSSTITATTSNSIYAQMTSSLTNKLLSKLSLSSTAYAGENDLLMMQSGACVGCGEPLTQATGNTLFGGSSSSNTQANASNVNNFVHCFVAQGLLCKKWCCRRKQQSSKNNADASDNGMNANVYSLLHITAGPGNQFIVPHLFIRNWDANTYPLCGPAYTYVSDMLDVCLYSINSLNPLLYEGIPTFKLTKNIRNKLVLLLDALLADRFTDVKQVSHAILLLCVKFMDLFLTSQVLAHIFTALGPRGIHLCMSTEFHSLGDLIAMTNANNANKAARNTKTLVNKLQELVVSLIKLADACKQRL